MDLAKVAELMAGRPTIPGWRYEAVCWDCKERHKGSELAVEEWIRTPCAQTGNGRHNCVAMPCYLNDGHFQCCRCHRNYVRIEGGQATENMCDFCLAKGLTPKPVKLLSSRTLPCGQEVTFSETNGSGRYNSHRRARFMFRGEGWGCCIPTSTYDTLSGRETHACGKRGEYHVVLPSGFMMPGGDGGGCGVTCTRHATELAKQGAEIRAVN